jgi:hypothetical protein
MNNTEMPIEGTCDTCASYLYFCSGNTLHWCSACWCSAWRPRNSTPAQFKPAQETSEGMAQAQIESKGV